MPRLVSADGNPVDLDVGTGAHDGRAAPFIGDLDHELEGGPLDWSQVEFVCAGPPTRTDSVVPRPERPDASRSVTGDLDEVDVLS